jgi:hypothetical protein
VKQLGAGAHPQSFAGAGGGGGGRGGNGPEAVYNLCLVLKMML